jgi:ubiquinone/menaquinone biosynthesis C-methylase UbiE
MHFSDALTPIANAINQWKHNTNQKINTGKLMEFEKEFVHDVYSNISEHFSNTRVIIWPKVIDFIQSWSLGSTILDIGCGNGKNMGTRKDCTYIGIDKCFNLLKKAELKDNCSFLNADCLCLPFNEKSFDYAMSIAVIHHLSNKDRRIKSLSEIARILKINGKALIYVWAFEQPKFENEQKQDVMVKWNLIKKYSNDRESIVYNRYYHLFIKNELEELINEIPDLIVIESGNQCNNWYCIVQKKN